MKSDTTLDISLDTRAMIDDLHALSALRAYLKASPDSRPSILTPDRSEALARVIADSLAIVALQVRRHVAAMQLNCHHDNNLPLSLTLTVDAPVGESTPRMLRLALDEAVKSMTVATCYTGIDDELADIYSSRTAAAISRIRAILSPPAAISLRQCLW